MVGESLWCYRFNRFSHNVQPLSLIAGNAELVYRFHEEAARAIENPALMGLYLFIFMIFTAHYSAYSYIEPFLKTIGLLPENFTTFLLLLFGSAGIIGSVILVI